MTWRLVGMATWPALSSTRERSSSEIDRARSGTAMMPRLFCEEMWPPEMPTTALRMRMPQACSAFSTATAMASRALVMLSMTPRESPAAGLTPTPRMRVSPWSPRSPTMTATLVDPTSMAATVLRRLMGFSLLQHRAIAVAQVDGGVVDAADLGLLLEGSPNGQLVLDGRGVAEERGLVVGRCDLDALAGDEGDLGDGCAELARQLFVDLRCGVDGLVIDPVADDAASQLGALDHRCAVTGAAHAED